MAQGRTIIEKDAVILGGGIAGLWLLNRLCDAGFDAVLLEHNRLGSGQTIASQGMIHGGIKYSLSGALTPASDALAGMPERWRACLEGRGEINLARTRILSPAYYMWPRSSFRSRLNAFLGSKALRGRVDALEPDRYPAFFRGRIPGPLYRLDDVVLDVPSLLESLCAPLRGRIYRIDWECARLVGDSEGIASLRLGGGEELEIHAQRFIFTAGAGVETLHRRFGLASTPMQRRPLHMVMLRHGIAEPIFVHCVADQLSSRPELTITTHACRQGGQVWYLGGELAESGAALDEAAQIGRARALLAELFPWCRLEDAEWAGFRIERAEAQQQGGARPDRPFVKAMQNFLVCWPTKLTLTPSLGDEVMAELRRQDILPRGGAGAALDLPFPGIAATPWDVRFA